MDDSNEQGTTASAPAPAKKNAPKRTAPFKPQGTYRPEDVARTLNVSGKVFRSWLRAHHPRKASEKGTSWVVPGKIANEYASLVRTTNSANPVKGTAKK